MMRLSFFYKCSDNMRFSQQVNLVALIYSKKSKGRYNLKLMIKKDVKLI